MDDVGKRSKKISKDETETVILRGEYPSGKVRDFERDSEIVEIMGTKIIGIDLEPLRSSTSLKKLRLSANKLQNVDLTPLSACTELKKLSIGNNPLQYIDLSPIGSCNKLEVLWAVRNELQNIDLSPLRSCKNLREVGLFGNKLTVIDLSHLGACTKLKTINLQGNQLKTIDLTPLSSATDLREVSVSGNQLEDIDLSPLSGCTKLWYLYISSNRIRDVDLTPLINCVHLKHLYLGHDQTLSIDITPLSLYKKLERLRLGEIPNVCSFLSRGALRSESPHNLNTLPTPLATLDFISKLLPIVQEKEPSWKLLHLLHEGLRLRGMSKFGLLDVSPLENIGHVLDEENDEMLEHLMISLVSQQIEGVGMTVGLVIEEMASSGEFVGLIDEVIRLRQEEISRISIGTEDGEYNLRSLALTAYGFKILHATGLGLKTDDDGIPLIERSFSDMGLEIQISEDGIATYPVQASEDMKRYIWALVEYASFLHQR